ARILKPYDDTPFTVTQAEPVVSVVRVGELMLKGWTERLVIEKPATHPKPGAGKGADASNPPTIRLVVELAAGKSRRIKTPGLSLTDPADRGLAPTGEFADSAPDKKSPAGTRRRQMVLLRESIKLQPGETVVPVAFKTATTDSKNKEVRTSEGTIDVVLLTSSAKPARSNLATTGVALVGGTLELKLGHLCDQRGCVAHLHDALGHVGGLAGVRPHPDAKQPRATVFLRAGQPIDLWGLRARLRDQGVEVTGITSGTRSGDRLRVELSSWKAEKDSEDAEQCLACRERTTGLLETLKWAKSIQVVGGGINIIPRSEPSGPIDLVGLLDMLAKNGTAPRHAWLLPVGVPMPKAAPARLTRRRVKPVAGGSSSHPLVEFEFAHSSDIGTDVLSLLDGHKWASHTSVEQGGNTVARLRIGDRKYANLKPLLNAFRHNGRIPQQIRLRGFGDIRIQIEFAHICGDVVYSKPKKSKKKKKGDKTKPFEPKPLRPAPSSNGRQAIEAAVGRVSWIKNAAFRDYHTRPTFNSPKKLWLAFEATGEDSVQLDELVGELRRVGFPPRSLIVSRRFSGLPFGKSLPGNLVLTDPRGKTSSLASFKQSKRPLAIVFVNLTSTRKKNYKADPKYFRPVAQTIEKYRDRVDFVAVGGNKNDAFKDLVAFWKKTDSSNVPLLDDADGRLRAALNAQATPAPHLFIFDREGKLRYAGDAHDQWQKKKPKNDFLGQAIDLVFKGKYLANGAVFYNKSLCNCSHPKCKCPKCGCGSTCRCAVGVCRVGF
ncbi:MAG: hypothetical protein VB859_18500, partial [Planctomycetaceae bacterium]